MNRVGDLNLWAIGFDDLDRAKSFRAEIQRLEDPHGLHVNDAIVVTRLHNGSFALDQDAQPSVATRMAGFGLLGFLVGL